MHDETGPARPRNAPDDHPALPARKTGVLLVNLGTPNATDYWSMRRYLREFLSDTRVIEAPKWLWRPILHLFILTTRPQKSGAAYDAIWNRENDESPLRTVTRAQTEKVAARLKATHGDQIVVDYCMRYGDPSTGSKIQELSDLGCDRIVFFPLYPQYSATTTATANDQAFRQLMKMRWQPAFRTVANYCRHPLYAEALAQSVKRAYEAMDRRPDALVASYHGLPKEYLERGDPYHCHCHLTTRLLRERLGWPEGEVTTCFQSRFGPKEWLQPYAVDHVAALARAGKRHIAVLAPAFSADCVETLEEINAEIREAFEAAGGERFDYIPCLNDDATHIDMMEAILNVELTGWI
ncbi:ferrochelatase [Pikeienuella piscinae]|uniref:Ferrochelatase n=1 Tax=Pikeienuella piscinae TaxID=2748098 RepID=A0A7L5BWN9_9RHOB|nr:ferrochelatase [Pikeienuella piscinae]QIE55861.1 ferrochelatase [Pikeienuella piscinae]